MNSASQRSRNQAAADSTSATQSLAVLVDMSVGVVPCPFRRGSATVNPSSASPSARGRTLCGLPV